MNPSPDPYTRRVITAVALGASPPVYRAQIGAAMTAPAHALRRWLPDQMTVPMIIVQKLYEHD